SIGMLAGSIGLTCDVFASGNRGTAEFTLDFTDPDNAVISEGGSGTVLPPNTKPDYIVTPEGVALPTNKDYNLVSTSIPTNQGGEFLQIHTGHEHYGVDNPHTHRPRVNIDPVSEGKGGDNERMSAVKESDKETEGEAIYMKVSPCKHLFSILIFLLRCRASSFFPILS
ncbi:MAG: hypothetical protein IJ801_07545, partial [Lachnospiraceae bacterium]|nr:hypothetical protein [Lachnospiraceae bacterium]